MTTRSSLPSPTPGELTLLEVQIPTKHDTVTIDGRHYRVLGDEGKIESLDDTISKYLPERYRDNPLWKDITIHQLLTHTSGVPNIPPQMSSIVRQDI